jgi:glycosyltransferase involved in cell wall biosynthesis
MGGAVTYLTNVLRLLPPAESGHEFYVFLPPETAGKQKNLPANIKLLPTRIGHASWWKRLWWEQVTIRRELKNLHGDFLFSTANFGMYRCPVRQILLVRIPLYFSKIYLDRFLPLHSWKFRASFKLRRWLCCQSARWADVVMTPTQTMMKELCAYVDMPPAKKLVNHYGVAAPSGIDVPRVPRRENPNECRLLYVSLYAEHKNLSTLLKSLPILNRDDGSRFLLVTTVNPQMKDISWMVTCRDDVILTQESNISPWVRIVGPLPREETSQLYLGSDIFVFPAITESFGHPMVEAMVHGLPIVAADTPVNREICGDAAIYFEPFDPEGLAVQVERLALDHSLRKSLTAKACEQVSRFLWTTHVERLVGALKGTLLEPQVINDGKAVSNSDKLEQRRALT